MFYWSRAHEGNQSIFSVLTHPQWHWFWILGSWDHPFCHLAADLNESSWPWKSARCFRIILLGLGEKSNRVYKSTSWFKSHYGINLYDQCSWIGFNLKDTLTVCNLCSILMSLSTYQYACHLFTCEAFEFTEL